MSEWERSKTQPPKAADKPEEGAAQAAGPESHEGQSASEGEGSCKWPPAAVGVTYELCAGLVDKPDLSLEEIARQEVLEECGYDVPASKLKRITSYRSGSLFLTLSEPTEHLKHGTRRSPPLTWSQQRQDRDLWSLVSQSWCRGWRFQVPHEPAAPVQLQQKLLPRVFLI